jgi:hypothetical protein
MNEAEYQEHLDWQQSVRERFPEFFRPGRYLEMSIGRGWRTLLEDLLSQIQEVVQKRGAGQAEVPFTILQIKEKFGGLRFYCENADDDIRALISTAEECAWTTCEECGEPGENRLHHGWWKVLCYKHYDEWVKRHSS